MKRLKGVSIVLNQRQIGILLELCKKPEHYFTASYFAKKQQVSLRTIQGDIKLIKDELSKEKCVSIYSEAPKGTRIHIHDDSDFSAFLNSLYQQYAHVSLNYPTSRVHQILLFLLNQQRAVSLQTIADKIYVSHSTLLNDLKKVSEILQEFNLDLIKSSNKIIVDGSEINKRLCLMERSMFLADIPSDYGHPYVDEKQISHIKNILTDTFVDFKYHIAETDFKNAILILNITIKRIQGGFYIKPFELSITDNLEKEKELSSSLFKKIENRFAVKVTEEEIDYFSLYLKSQGNYQKSPIISDEMDSFISDAFIKIKNNFGIDFTDNINLRISLALHCTPLSIRIKYDMQLKNNMLDYIKQNFPLGYDLGTYFAFLMQQKYHKKISDDEIAWIALHFYNSLVELNNRGTKRVLIISSMKSSMTTLLRQTLLNWFSGNISVLDFLNAADMTDDALDNYDIFLTTEKGEYFDKGLAMLINVFPNNHDYLNIKLAIDGFKDIEDIIQIFCEDLFYQVESTNKNDILSTLCNQSAKKFHLNTLSEEVMKREEIGSTFFSKSIAVPHPVHSVSSDTFVAIGISVNPIEWDEEKNLVNLVMLVCIGKNNPQAFQLWNYFSKMFADKSFTEKIIAAPTYENFIKIVKEALKTGIQDNDTK